MSKKLEAFKRDIAKMDTYKLLGLYGEIYYTCKEPVIQRALRRVQKDVIEQIYRNPMSNNQRRRIFYDVLKNPRCRTGQRKFFFME